MADNEKLPRETSPTSSDNHDASEPHMSPGRYAATRLTTLKPPMARAPNPIKLLMMLSFQQWMFFLVAFIAWTWDAFDFFTVSLTVGDLAETFNKSNTDITWGITLVLMFRSVGSTIFGIAADRYGRKWPFIVNNILFIVLELGTGFTQTYGQFLAVRALFGVAMGGLYGNAAATALEDCPDAARGIISGMLQQGYAFGYLLATAFARGLVNTTSHGWRPLFWFGAGPPVLIILFRLCLPETKSFRDRQALKQAQGNLAGTFISEGKVALRKHWLLLIYLVLLMAGFNFMRYCYFIRCSAQWLIEAATAPRISIPPCLRISSNSLPTVSQSRKSLRTLGQSLVAPLLVTALKFSVDGFR
jgi:MFS transporter, SHS family, lactate transporter